MTLWYPEQLYGIPWAVNLIFGVKTQRVGYWQPENRLSHVCRDQLRKLCVKPDGRTYIDADLKSAFSKVVVRDSKKSGNSELLVLLHWHDCFWKTKIIISSSSDNYQYKCWILPYVGIWGVHEGKGALGTYLGVYNWVHHTWYVLSTFVGTEWNQHRCHLLVEQSPRE